MLRYSTSQDKKLNKLHELIISVGNVEDDVERDKVRLGKAQQLSYIIITSLSALTLSALASLAPFHSSQVWDKVIMECVTNPAQASEKCPEGYLRGSTPLNMFLYYGKPPLAVVESLYEAHKDAISEVDSTSDVPLHTAVYKKSSLDVIEYLYSLWPEAIERQNKQGWLPIHYACGHGQANQSVMEFLHSKYPSGLRVEDR